VSPDDFVEALSRVETYKKMVGDGGTHPKITGTFVYIHKEVPSALNARKKKCYRSLYSIRQR
jgi:hypothetical protein